MGSSPASGTSTGLRESCSSPLGSAACSCIRRDGGVWSEIRPVAGWRSAAYQLIVRLCTDNSDGDCVLVDGERRPGGGRMRSDAALSAQCIPEPPLSCLTSSPITFLASPNNIQVRSEKYSSLSMPEKPGFFDRFMAKTSFALSASMIGIP